MPAAIRSAERHTSLNSPELFILRIRIETSRYVIDCAVENGPLGYHAHVGKDRDRIIYSV